MGLFDLFKKNTKKEPKESTVSKTEVFPYQGEYAKAVFLSAYSKPTTIPPMNGYNRYVQTELGIKDVEKYHRSLVESGELIQVGAEQLLQSMKVDELKNILSSKHLSVEGKKTDLIERILNEVPKDELPQTDMFAISEKGNEYLKEHEDYVLFHRNNYGFTFKEYEAAKRDGLRFNDTIWGLLNQRLLNDGNHRSAYYDMYRLLREENKNQSAYEMLLRVFYYDISGMEGLTYFKDKFWNDKQRKDGFSVAVMLAPRIIGDLKTYGESFDPKMIGRIFEWELPIRLCDEKLFQKIVESIINGTYDENTVLKKLRTEYNKMLKEV